MFFLLFNKKCLKWAGKPITKEKWSKSNKSKSFTYVDAKYTHGAYIILFHLPTLYIRDTMYTIYILYILNPPMLFKKLKSAVYLLKRAKERNKNKQKMYFFFPIILTFVPGNINILIMYAYSVLILRFHHIFGQSWIYMENIMIRFAIYMCFHEFS